MTRSGWCLAMVVSSFKDAVKIRSKGINEWCSPAYRTALISSLFFRKVRPSVVPSIPCSCGRGNGSSFRRPRHRVRRAGLLPFPTVGGRCNDKKKCIKKRDGSHHGTFAVEKVVSRFFPASQKCPSFDRQSLCGPVNGRSPSFR
jgi:hypothetical protein